MRRILFMIIGISLFLTSVVAGQETPPADGVAVTVYNQGTALVRDRRTFTFDRGVNTLNFTDVAALIDPTSVTFSSLTDPQGTRVLEQNYAYDLVDISALLTRYLDETIVVTAEDGTVYSGQLLSGRNGDLILRQTDGQVVVVSVHRARDVQFPSLPEGLITRPTLRWLLNASQGGAQQVELTYLTGGLNWSADYNILLANDNSTLDLNGWVTLNNNSGTHFQDAQLKLVAGDVNRVAAPQPGMAMERAVMMSDAMADEGVQQREFFEYQLYEVARRVTIGNNETKQVEFVTGAGIPASTFYVYDASPGFYGYYSPISDRNYYGESGITTVQNYLEFSTDADGGLGADLPAGRIRVYQEDIDGSALLIGENTIRHTPEGESLEIYLGNAFDLVGQRTQMDFGIVSDKVIRETFEIRLRNRKDSGTVEIRVPERLYRWSNWEILNSSHEHTRLNSSTIEFRVQVPAGEEVVLSYMVQYSWR